MSLATIQSLKALKLAKQHDAILSGVTVPQNIFTDQSPTYLTGYYGRDGSFTTATDEMYTSIAVKQGETYKLTGSSYINMPLYLFVGSDNSKSTFPTAVTNSEVHHTDISFTAPHDGTLYVHKLNFSSFGAPKVSKATSVTYNLPGANPAYQQQNVSFVSGNYYDRNGAKQTDSQYSYTTLTVYKGDVYKITGADYYNMALYLFIGASGSKSVYPTATYTTGSVHYNVTFTASENGTLYINKNWIYNPIILKQQGTIITDNPLYTKVMYSEGDSVSFGAGSSSGSYVDIIATNNVMSYKQGAVSGTTLAIRTGRTDSILERIKSLTGAYDYILLEGGYNDMFTSVPIGSLTTGYTATLDETTVIGAVESMCKALITNYPTTKKLFVLGHRAVGLDGSWATQTDTYWNAVQSALEKWSVPYVDIRKSGGLVAYNQTWLTNYFGPTETMGTHPNYTGYLTFYVPQVTAKLKSL